ncbi:MAG: hypothetical protein DWH81_13420, partial [Planctomycetota bacterium]
VFVLLSWDERRQNLVNQIRETGRGVRVLLIRGHVPSTMVPEESLDFQLIEPEQIASGEVRSL